MPVAFYDRHDTILKMDTFSALVVLNCFVSPVLFFLLVWAGYLYIRKRIEASREKERLENKLSVVSRTAQNAVRETWFEEISDAKYFSELEVETKFVYPLMRFLGYKMRDLRMRVTGTIRVGRQGVAGVADWIVFQNDKPAIVIEVKSPSEKLDNYAQEQARSYCFALNLPTYILVNGKEIKVYRRGVESDMLVFESPVGDLSAKWTDLRMLIGVPE